MECAGEIWIKFLFSVCFMEEGTGYWGFPAQVSVLNHTISQKGESYEEPLTAVFERNAFLRPLHWKHLFLFMQFFIYKRISYIFILERLFLIEKKKPKTNLNLQTPPPTFERKIKISYPEDVSKEGETGSWVRCFHPGWPCFSKALKCIHKPCPLQWEAWILTGFCGTAAKQTRGASSPSMVQGGT